MANWFKQKIRDHFGFSKTETNGVFLLLWLIIGFVIIPQTLRWYYYKNTPVNDEADIALLDSTVAELEAQQLTANQSPRPTKQPEKATKEVAKRQHKARPNKSIPDFDINLADTTQLQQIKGIGPVLSTRVVQYRDRLGGFVNPSQYLEIYGLKPWVLKQLTAYTYIAPDFQPKCININTSDFKTLLAHPYLNYQQVQRMIQCRDKHGKWDNIEALYKENILEAATFERVKFYLRVATESS